ncbi:hypothetical protein KC360_g47 [Hortaea werneckii]|nr:hypothetical protein KC344_g46 [Hortaea werneckii]KAI7180387.1 hypothetical protein KC360_g47 [Hortaea werneckii]
MALPVYVGRRIPHGPSAECRVLRTVVPCRPLTALRGFEKVVPWSEMARRAGLCGRSHGEKVILVVYPRGVLLRFNGVGDAPQLTASARKRPRGSSYCIYRRIHNMMLVPPVATNALLSSLAFLSTEEETDGTHGKRENEQPTSDPEALERSRLHQGCREVQVYLQTLCRYRSAAALHSSSGEVLKSRSSATWSRTFTEVVSSLWRRN